MKGKTMTTTHKEMISDVIARRSALYRAKWDRRNEEAAAAAGFTNVEDWELWRELDLLREEGLPEPEALTDSVLQDIISSHKPLTMEDVAQFVREELAVQAERAHNAQLERRDSLREKTSASNLKHAAARKAAVARKDAEKNK